MKVLGLLIVALNCCSLSCFDLTILHVNDIHVRMEETNEYSSTCKQSQKDAGKCYGGVARLRRAVQDIKKTNPNVLWLNAGDFFQGTIWYSQFKWRVVSQFSNLLDFDAITLGNHEFDDKLAGVIPFLRNQSRPVVVSNLNTTLVPEMKNLTVSSVKYNIGEKTVGLVGYLTPDTKFIANPEQLIILDEIESLKPVVEHLHSEGVDIIIALGHSGYEKDKEIAASVPHLDVVIGGHTHSFLYTPTEESANPSNNPIRGPYPTIVDNSAGHKTIVLQAYAYTKYLGNIDLKFSSAGELETWSGAPILLDSRYPKDPEVERQLGPYRQQLAEIGKAVLGSAARTLLVSRDRESRMGNFVADAMVRSWEDKVLPGNTKVRIALANSGGIRAPFDSGNITQADLMTAFPFSNTFDLIRLKGQFIREALEHSVSKMTRFGEDGEGRFLQVSGIKVVYNVTEPVGSRVMSVKVAGEEDGGEMVELEEERLYYVVTSNYIVSGGDGYSMLHDNNVYHNIGTLDTDVVKKELLQRSPVTADLEGRIVIHSADHDQTTNGVELIALNSIVVLLSVISTSIF